VVERVSFPVRMSEAGDDMVTVGQLVLTLGVASRALQTLLIAQARAGGLGLLEFLVLSRACDGDGVVPLEAGRALGLSSGTMTGVADRLEQSRLIRRTPHPSDRRQVLLAATAKGRRLIERILRPVLAETRDLATALDPAARAAIDAFLNELVDMMGVQTVSLPPRRGVLRARTPPPERPGATSVT
jgi:DNA-binding MarR family transcriptional regulator